jgi:hydroxymethylpyrimidine/phosphomethylpyrimidine kinase
MLKNERRITLDVKMKTALSIAGSDSSGGAGIQADIKTMSAHGVYAMTAVTALTAQNTTGVAGIQEATPEFLSDQLDAVFTDIFPDAVKIGMVSSAELIEVIAEKLRRYKARHIVVDPVMVATSGSRLLQAQALDALKSRLLPLAEVVTPNIPEAEAISGMEIKSADDMEKVARDIGQKHGCAVLLKGGHSLNDANDLLYRDGCCAWFRGRRIDTRNTHGTGCTLSSAIASNLACGMELEAAVQAAKEYISGALAAMLDLGRGNGPMNHLYDLKSRFIKEAD